LSRWVWFVGMMFLVVRIFLIFPTSQLIYYCSSLLLVSGLDGTFLISRHRIRPQRLSEAAPTKP
jgi:hypothetical protein